MAPVCTPSNTCFLRPTSFLNPNGILIWSAGFAQLTTEYTLQLAAVSPQNCSFPSGTCMDPIEYMIPWANLSPQSKSHLDRLSRFLHGSLLWQTDRPRNHTTRSLTISCIYERSTSMRHNKIYVRDRFLPVDRRDTWQILEIRLAIPENSHNRDFARHLNKKLGYALRQLKLC